jgi:hypothetical protein
MKKLINITLCALAAVAVAAAVAGVGFYRHTMVLERNFAMNLKVTEIQQGENRVVRISGFCGHSSQSVKDITTRRAGSSIVVLVHIWLVRNGATGAFEYDVPVPDGVNDVRFGNDQVVIWRRNAGGPSLTQQ